MNLILSEKFKGLQAKLKNLIEFSKTYKRSHKNY